MVISSESLRVPGPIAPSTSATRLIVLPVCQRSSTIKTRMPATESAPGLMAAPRIRALSCGVTFFICGVVLALTTAASLCMTPRLPATPSATISARLAGALKRRWRRHHAVNLAGPVLSHESGHCLDDIAWRSTLVLQLIDEFAARGDRLVSNCK